MTEATQKYVKPDGAAESPLPDYPGRIKFPLVMTLPMHKRWQKWVNEQAEGDADMRVGVAFAEGGDRLLFQYGDVELALMFGELDAIGPDGKKLTNKTASDGLPLPVAVWIAKAYREWENSQLMFRWNGGVDLVAPDSAA